MNLSIRKIGGKIYRGLRKVRYVALTPLLLNDYRKFRKQGGGKNRFSMSLRNAQPELLDKTITTGFDHHYVYHTSWAARVLAETRPRKHIDISSSLYFVGIASAFVTMEFYDYRPAELGLSNLECKNGDLTALPFADNSVESISCMHTVEHVGLGRYGDPVDPDGDLKAARELERVTAKGGSLLFVVPIAAKPWIQFNAHRVYTYDLVLSMFPKLKLKEFALIPVASKGGLIRNADTDLIRGETYACGCFWFTK